MDGLIYIDLALDLGLLLMLRLTALRGKSFLANRGKSRLSYYNKYGCLRSVIQFGLKISIHNYAVQLRLREQEKTELSHPAL